MDNTLFEQVDNYISALFAPQDEALEEAATSSQHTTLPFGNISPNQGKLLQVLARMCNAHRILELGTLAGYSTIWLARALPAGGRLVTIEFEPQNAEIARANLESAGLSTLVDIRVGKAIDTLQQIQQENTAPFDMVFIDADKPPYAEYLVEVLKLSRPGTIIVADNVIRNGKVLDETISDERVQGVQRFNKMLAACPGVTATILQTVGVKEHDGIAIAVVNYV